MNVEQRGACADLPPAVVNKYFFPRNAGFQQRVGKIICERCPIRTTCLEEAIVEPPGLGTRGGEANPDLWRLHDRWMAGEDSEALVAERVSAMPQLQRLHRFDTSKGGRFVDVPLAYPELGGGAA